MELKIELILNIEDPFKHYLENETGDRFYFNPNSTNGRELDSFLVCAVKKQIK
ncbi:hypothetical protein [Changchengzhania lutea]|uniref:hypothetical protein n=1 Tax=Changchengzhania lutea TaxID=2049305 RepID=UPI00163D5A0F|nr:hypothetical protein [Changchengzhania lutea]